MRLGADAGGRCMCENRKRQINKSRRYLLTLTDLHCRARARVRAYGYVYSNVLCEREEKR